MGQGGNLMMLWIPERLGLPKIKGDDQSKGHLTCVVGTLKCNTNVCQVEIVCHDLTCCVSVPLGLSQQASKIIG